MTIYSIVFNLLATLVAGILVLVGAPLFFVFVVLLSLVRDHVCLFAKLWKERELGELVTSFGPIMATDGPFVKDALTQYAVLELDDAEPDIGLLRGEFQRLVVDARDPGTGGLLYPELQCTVEPWLGYLFWKPLKSYNLASYYIEYKDTGLPLPKWEEDGEALNDLLTHLGRRAWKKGHPLIEVILVPRVPKRFFSVSPFEGAGSLIIFRAHHALLDGCAATGIWARALNVSLPPPPVLPKKHPLITAGIWTIHALKVSLYMAKVGLLGMVYAGAVLPEQVPKNQEDHGNDRVVTIVVKALPLQLIREIKKGYKTEGFNAVVLSGVAGALRRMYKQDQQTPPNLIPAAVTLPLWDHPLTLVNHATAGVLFIPTGGKNPKERLDYFRKAHVKVDLVMARILFHIAVQVEKFPFTLVKIGRRILSKCRPSSGSLGGVGLSNVMFPVGNHKLGNVYLILGGYAGMNSPPKMGKSIGLYLTSFNNSHMRLVVTSRGTAFKDRDQARKFAEYLRQEWDAMLEGASAKKASNTVRKNTNDLTGEMDLAFVA